MKNLTILIFLFLIVIFALPIIFAEKNVDEVVRNLIIDIDGTDVLRSGNEIIIRPIIINNNSNISVEIKQIKFLTSTKKEVTNFNVDENLKAIKNKLDRYL